MMPKTPKSFLKKLAQALNSPKFTIYRPHCSLQNTPYIRGVFLGNIYYLNILCYNISMSTGDFYIPKHADFRPEDIIGDESRMSDAELHQAEMGDWDDALKELCAAEESASTAIQGLAERRRPHFKDLPILPGESYDSYVPRFVEWLKNNRRHNTPPAE